MSPGHQDFVLQEQWADSLFLGLLINLLFKVDGGILGQQVFQCPVELFRILTFMPFTGTDGLADKFGKIHSLGIGHHLEFELGGIAEQFHGPFRILDAGKLDNDLIISLTNDYRLGDTELINPVAQDLKGLVDRVCIGYSRFLISIRSRRYGESSPLLSRSGP